LFEKSNLSFLEKSDALKAEVEGFKKEVAHLNKIVALLEGKAVR
jgi:hypothetical protein